MGENKGHVRAAMKMEMSLRGVSCLGRRVKRGSGDFPEKLA